LESQFKTAHYLDFYEFSLQVNDVDFQRFANSSGQYIKADFDPVSWNLIVRDNVLVADAHASTNYNSLHFAIVADFIRHELIKQKKSFAFETVFSHPSKLDLLDLAHAEGFKIYLYFVGTNSAFINQERVKDRVLKGGHDVNIQNVHSRYSRTMDLLLDIMKKCDVSFLWDNSGEEFLYLGTAENKQLLFQPENVPAWVFEYLIDKLN
jgi:predicted ABC-type ATPase